jgi:hypothetical protein
MTRPVVACVPVGRSEAVDVQASGTGGKQSPCKVCCVPCWRHPSTQRLDADTLCLEHAREWMERGPFTIGATPEIISAYKQQGGDR